MLRISIDGACRRNGKPDCTSSGGVFVQQFTDAGQLAKTWIQSAYEYNSTNQRGEMLALLKALDFVASSGQEAQIITDSEYLFNAMTRRWYSTWANQNWLTGSGAPVKNRDIWQEITNVVDKLKSEVHFYHIKGHCISFGRVTADNMLNLDPTGLLLYSEVCNKFDKVASTKTQVFNAAQELSIKNNGFRCSDEVFKWFVTANTVADAIATKVVDAADRER